mmetsp:Transcript_15872/g.42421  ORF Transcript_15872/g.42421 Transcript_15872/m.42421 type:complete len:325 (+) Transcript_15872:1295-2269(+)
MDGHEPRGRAEDRPPAPRRVPAPRRGFRAAVEGQVHQVALHEDSRLQPGQGWRPPEGLCLPVAASGAAGPAGAEARGARRRGGPDDILAGGRGQGILHHLQRDGGDHHRRAEDSDPGHGRLRGRAGPALQRATERHGDRPGGVGAVEDGGGGVPLGRARPDPGLHEGSYRVPEHQGDPGVHVVRPGDWPWRLRRGQDGPGQGGPGEGHPLRAEVRQQEAGRGAEAAEGVGQRAQHLGRARPPVHHQIRAVLSRHALRVLPHGARHWRGAPRRHGRARAAQAPSGAVLRRVDHAGARVPARAQDRLPRPEGGELPGGPARVPQNG